MSLEQARHRRVSGATLDVLRDLLPWSALPGGELLGVVAAEGWFTEGEDRDDADDLRRVNGILNVGKR